MAHPFGHRLIYAADPDFSDCATPMEVQAKAMMFLDQTITAFQDLGIIIKGNTLFRVLGIMVFSAIREAGCKIFGDYKLFDTQGTIENDASWLRTCSSLSILTVQVRVHPSVFTMLHDMLPHVIVAPVDPLTDLTDTEFKLRGEGSREEAIRAFFNYVTGLPARGVICAPSDLQYAPDGFTTGRKIITPAIRPAGATIPGDKNAANALTPIEALRNGASHIVVGDPIRLNNDLRGNALRILDEMAKAAATVH